MNRVRIIVGEMPRLLRDIVEDTVRSQPDMELVDGGEEHDLAMSIKRNHADVVILAEPGADCAGSHEQLLLENPGLKVLVVTHDGREAHLLEFRKIPVAEVSPQGLVDAIRAAVVSGKS